MFPLRLLGALGAYTFVHMYTQRRTAGTIWATDVRKPCWKFNAIPSEGGQADLLLD